MAEARANLNAGQLRSELKRIVDLVLVVTKAQREQITVTVQQTKVGVAYTAVIKGLGNANDRYRLSIRGVNDQLKKVATSTDTAANRADKLEKETRQARIEQKRLADEARKTSQALQRQSFGRGGQTGALARGVTQGELFNFQNELGKLRELQTRHALTSKQVLAQWRVVAAGRVNAETGVRRKVQVQLLKIKQAHERLGRDATNAQRKINEEARKTEERLKKGTKAADGFRLSWRNLIRIAGISLGLRAINAFIGAIREGITAAKEFSISVAEVQTIDRANVSTQQWTASLRELSDSFGIDIVDQAEAAYQALSNQVVTGADATEFLAAANRLAITAVTDTSTAVNLLTASINAFGLDASSVDDIAAKFFKTVELGRLRIDDISEVFGRVAVPASQLGITLEELNAGFAALTIQGIKASEASTLIRNIVLKLIRPTDALKETLADLGVESGKAAIETFGFGGTLIKLIETTGGSVQKLGELFGRIRAISGVLGFAKDGLVTYNKALVEINKSSETFAERTDIITRSAGFELRKALNEVANIFKVDIGQASLEALRDLTGGFKGLVTATKTTLFVLRTLAIATIPALVVALVILTLALVKAKIALVKLVVTNPLFLLVTAIGAVVAILFELEFAARRAAEATSRAFIEELDAIKKLEAEERASFNRRLQQQRDFLKRRSQAAIITATNLIGSVNKQGRAFAATFKAVSKALKDDFKSLTDFAKNQVSEAEKDFDKVTKKIQALKDDIKTTFESEGRTVFDLRFSILDDPEAQIKLITRRLNELREQAKQAVDDPTRLKALLKEIQALSIQRGQILVENVEEAKQQEAINVFAKSHNDLLKEKVSLIEQALKLQNEQLDKERESTKQAEETAKRLAEAIKTFTTFDPAALAKTRIEAGDDPKTVLKTVEDRFKAQTAAGQEILRINAARGDDALKLIGLAKLLTATEKQGAEELKSIRTKNLIDIAKAKLEDFKKDALNAKEEQKLDRARVDELRKQLEDLTRAFGAEDVSTILSTFFGDLIGQAGAGRRVKVGDTFVRGANEAERAIREQLLQVAEIFKGFIEATSGDDPQKIGDASARVVKAFEFLRQNLLVQDPRVLSEAQLALIKLVRDNAKTFSKLFGEAEFKRVAQLQKRFNESVVGREQTEKKIKELQKLGLSSQQAVNLALKNAEGNLTDFNTALDKLIKFLKNNPLTPTANAQPKSRGGFVSRFQNGGFVPTGTDTIPAMLTPGEFVMNAAATRKFASQLVSMNSNIQPQRFQHGGPVNNNDITLNITVDGATQSPDQMAVEIGQALKRQIRRGTLSLN